MTTGGNRAEPPMRNGGNGETGPIGYGRKRKPARLETVETGFEWLALGLFAWYNPKSISS